MCDNCACADDAVLTFDPAPPTNMAEKSARKRCPKGHDCPALKQITRTFELQDVLNVYIVGSHLWGTCHRHSDWDLVVVVRDASQKPLNVHKGLLEAFVVSESDYMELIDAHSMQVLVTLWLPPECVLQETFDPRALFHFNKSVLLKSLNHTRERDLRVAEKHFRKADSKQAKKVLTHCIRCLCLATQIRTTGHIQEYGTSTQHRIVVLEDRSNSWEGLLSTVQPILDSLWSELEA